MDRDKRPTGPVETSRTTANPPATDAGSSQRALIQRKLRQRVLQRRADREVTSANVEQSAEHGISGSGGALPHQETIQRAFGHHDVSGIEAHTDGRAQQGAHAMGAEAFATGNHVAFAGAPSLHTAAHEAAHVVQQRGGVQLKGGVGAEGDVYERHADSVADAVVAGKSAEGLLDAHAGPARSSSGGGVQHKLATKGLQAPGHEIEKALKAYESGFAAADHAHNVTLLEQIVAAIGADLTAVETRQLLDAVKQEIAVESAAAKQTPAPNAPPPAQPAATPPPATPVAAPVVVVPPPAVVQSGAPQPPVVDDGKGPHRHAVKTFFSSAGPSVKGAKDFAALAAAIQAGLAHYDADEHSKKLNDTPVEIHKRYVNMHRGIERATAFYRKQLATSGDQKWAKAEQKFITERLALALPDQANTIGDTMIAEGQKPVEQVSAGGVHLSNSAWNGLMKNAKTVLAAENVDGADAHESMAAAKADGGIAKVFSLSQVWRNMVPPLQTLWTTVYGDAKAAGAKFNEQCKARGTLVTKPEQGDVDGKNDPTLNARFAQHAAVDGAFEGGVTGFCGMANDYILQQKTFKTLEKALALNPSLYALGVGVVCKIPAGQLDDAAKKAKAGGATDENVVGKPSVFNSLMFSEFNYVCDDRARGKTGGDGSNSGVADPDGKAEVTVTNMPFSAFLSGGFELFV